MAATPFLVLSSALPLPAALTLHDALSRVPDHRSPRGVSYPFLPFLKAIVAAMFAGACRPADMHQWIEERFHDHLRDACGFTTPRAPGRTNVYLFLRGLDWQALETAIRAWVQEAAWTLVVDSSVLALDGKEARGIRKVCDDVLLMVSAFSHETGLTVGSQACRAGEEIETARSLLRELDLKGKTVTLDALHTQVETAQLIADRGGDYLLPVKKNQPRLREAIMRKMHRCDRGLAKGAIFTDRSVKAEHGRLECRRITVLQVDAKQIDWVSGRQVYRIERNVEHVRTGKKTHSVAYGITSLSATKAKPARLLKLNRDHWQIETRSHWIRDVHLREDAGQAYLDNTAEVLAVLRCLVMTTLRLLGVKCMAGAFRSLANHPWLSVAIATSCSARPEL